MRRLVTLAVVMMMAMTATYAQKRTSYKFTFKYAIEIESQDEANCDVLFEIVDKPGETPYINLVNNADNDTERNELKPVVVYKENDNSVFFYKEDGPEFYALCMTAKGGCTLLVMENDDNGTPKLQYGLSNEEGTPDNAECAATFKALIDHVKANALNNFTVKTLQ